MSLDEFREAGSYMQDEEPDSSKGGKSKKSRRSGSSGGALGITPAQRFIIAAMILFMTCLLGTFCLVLTGRIVPPGLF
jgi:hypothetical protein